MAGIVEFVLRLKDEASGAIKKTTEESEDLVGAQKNVTSATAISGAALLGYATAAIGAATAMAALVKSSVDATNALLDASTRTGVAAETLQGLKLAAEGSGLSFQSVEGIMAGFTNRLASAAGGSKEAAEAFKRLGVETRNATTGGMRDADDILKETIARIQAIPNATDRATAATLAFGRQGTKLLQALGTSQLEDFTAVANRFGVDVGPKAAKAAGDWQRQQALLSLTLDGAKDALVASLGGATAMTEAMRAMGQGVIFVTSLFPFMIDTLAAAFAPLRTLTELVIGTASAYMKLAQGDFAGAFTAATDGFAAAANVLADSAQTIIDTPGRLDAALKAGTDLVEGYSKSWRDLGQIINTPDNGKTKIVAITEDAKAAKEEVKKLGDTAFETFEKFASTDNLFGPIIAGLNSLIAIMTARFNSFGIIAGQLMGGQIQGALEIGVKAAGEAINGLLGGPGGAAAGGMIGGAVAKALGGLGTLGEEGSGAIVDKIIGSIDGIGKGIEEIPKFLFKLVERLPRTLLKLAGSILKMLPELLFTVLIRMPTLFRQGIALWWSEAWGAVKGWFASLFGKGSVSIAEVERRGGTVGGIPNQGPAGFNSGFGSNGSPVLGSRDTGGLIPQTGLYMLHQGETVVRGANQAPSSGSVAAAGRAAGAGVSGSTVIVNVSSPVADSNFAEFMGRELERIFGAGGLRTSTVIG